jgi:hypothetical protein
VTTDASLGPVSAALEADLRAWVRRHGVVVWLDGPGHFADFVARLEAARTAGDLPYDVKAFHGSHLETLLDLEGLADGADRTPLVLHLPGFNETSVAATPLYELYSAGVRYRKRLDTLVTDAASGHVRPEEIAEFVATPDLTLAMADEWLAECQSGSGAGVAAELRARSATDILDDLTANGAVARRFDQAGVATAVWNRLATVLGIPDAWKAAAGDLSRADEVAIAAAGWALAVEYAQDLSRAAASRLLASATDLPDRVIEACVALAAHLRHTRGDFYRRAADDAASLLPEEQAAAGANELGEVDTFRFEEERVYAAACEALEASRFAEAGRHADARLGATARSGFWARAIPGREAAWRLIDAAARLGIAIEAAGPRLPVDGGFAGVAEAYVAKAAAVDRRHRLLEQARASGVVTLAGDFEQIRGGVEAARLAYRGWADAWARDLSAFCRAHGFLPEPSLQQRTIFDAVVKPLVADDGPTAYFLIDALRYEMAEEVLRAFEAATGTTARLTARFAELPTVTEVGMNSLAPVARNGRLATGSTAEGLAGFSTGEFRVHDPETRRRAMHDRVGGGTCPLLTLDDVVERDAASLKRSIGRARLVVVHARDIDVAGEAGVGLDEFDKAVLRIKAAWQLLREAGVKRFVVTSDHGFLLPMGPLASLQPHGRRIDPKPRYALAPVAAATPGEAAVALADLGYDGAEGCVVFPETTAVFDTGGRPPVFVHGGNSLQERLIPVVTAVHRTKAGGRVVKYDVTARGLAGVAGMHCLEATLKVASQTALAFDAAETVALALRVPDDDTIRVELCDVRGALREGGVVQAPVGERFEIFFRLHGPTDLRMLVELFHPGIDARVAPGGPEARFEVTPAAASPAARQPARGGEAWLESIDDDGHRQVFAHIAAHGSIAEAEVASLLGGPRPARRFAVRFDELAARAPFRVRIENLGGVKRYLKEGGDR